MRNVLLISLVLLHLLGNTELCQLLKLPKILEHYHLHQLMNPKADFIDFIGMHYFGDDGINADDNQDRELPFLGISHQSVLVATTPPHLIYPKAKIVACDSRSFGVTIPSSLLPSHAKSLRRPPRMHA